MIALESLRVLRANAEAQPTYVSIEKSIALELIDYAIATHEDAPKLDTKKKGKGE